jgi:hypothetical protein
VDDAPGTDSSQEAPCRTNMRQRRTVDTLTGRGKVWC